MMERPRPNDAERRSIRRNGYIDIASRRSRHGPGGGSVTSERTDGSSSEEDNTSVDSAPRRTDRSLESRSSSGASPFSSTDGGTETGAGTRVIPGVAARPAVPFGASALSKTLPNTGRGRPRGLRPRGSSGNGSSLGRSMLAAGRSGSFGGGVPKRHVKKDIARGGEEEARLAAERLAPGVPVGVVEQAAVKVESVMRVLIARGYVRRKLVSEVTAFSLIMERGIEVIKHPFSGKAKPKNVTVNFVSRKGAMQLSWGGRGGVPLETIYGVTKGIKTDALKRVVGPERAENCFSLLTPDRTIDFEVDNPWLVLLVVRAMRLFLGAHYDTLPAPTFFSHLCIRPKGSGGTGSPKQTLVWTGDEKTTSKEPTSTPTERTSGDSDYDSDHGHAVLRGSRTPWEASEYEEGAPGADDDDCGSVFPDSVLRDEASDGGAADRLPSSEPAREAFLPEPASNRQGGAMSARAQEDDRTRGHDDQDDLADKERQQHLGDPYTDTGTDDNEGEAADGQTSTRSPGGIMSLFAGGRRSGSNHADGIEESEEPLTASQLLAVRGASKRLANSHRISGGSSSSQTLKGKRFNLMALPADSGERRESRGSHEGGDNLQKRNQGMSISIGAGYQLPEEQNRDTGNHDPERVVVDDLNDKLQSLRKLCVPQQRLQAYRPGRSAKTMAGKHMAFFQGAGGAVVGGMGSLTDMWGDGVRKQYQTDMVRQKNESVEDVRKREDVRTAMLVNRSGVHRVTRKAAPPSPR